jgi:glycosyltransferase involved in cell wall biosynthesis
VTKRSETAETVYLNGRFLSQPTTGVQRVAAEIIHAIDRLIADGQCPDFRFRILAPRNASRRLKLSNIPQVTAGRLTGYGWEQTELAWYAKTGRLISFCNLGPVLHKRQIVMIHDTQVFAMPENFSRAFVAFYRRILPLLGRRARSVLTVSAFSKGELVANGVAPEMKVAVVPNGVDHALRAAADDSILQQSGLRPRGYVLAVGTDKRSKNFDLLRDSVAGLASRNLQLAIAGGHNRSVFEAGEEGSDRGVDIVYCRDLDDARLRALYENAFCLAIPSLHEGFGLPAAEAMMCGCPVIASKRASLPEICGDAALFCEPLSVDSFLQQVDRLAGDAELRETCIARGRDRAQSMTWRRSAALVIECLRSS